MFQRNRTPYLNEFYKRRTIHHTSGYLRNSPLATLGIPERSFLWIEKNDKKLAL
ncbi:hypothetical protein IQA89_07745 [Leptospira borgpetersenii serovar Balcanica]|nr:hypothetical protein [Leptospira borgpetersenii serovar Balcanica]